MFLIKDLLKLFYKGFIRNSPSRFIFLITLLAANLFFFLLLIDATESILEIGLAPENKQAISLNSTYFKNIFLLLCFYFATNNYLLDLLNIIGNSSSVYINMSLYCPSILKNKNKQLEVEVKKNITTKTLNKVLELSFSVPIFLKLLINDIPSLIAILYSLQVLISQNSQPAFILYTIFFAATAVVVFISFEISKLSKKISTSQNLEINSILSEISKDLNLSNSEKNDFYDEEKIKTRNQKISVNFKKTKKSWAKKTLTIMFFQSVQLLSIILLFFISLLFIQKSELFFINTAVFSVILTLLFHIKFYKAINTICLNCVGICYAKSIAKAINTNEKSDSFDRNIYSSDLSDLFIKNLNLKNKNEFILKDINLRAKAGETISIIYNNQSEADQLIKIISGAYDSFEGDCIVKKFEEKNRSTFRKIKETDVCLVSQNAKIIFKDSIKNNILMGNKVSEEILKNIIKLAAMDSIISALPKEEDTIINSSSSFITKSLIKKISFARHLVTGKSITLFNGLSLSNNNNISENIISEQLINITKQKICIIFTNNPLETIFADRIYVLNSGQIIEEGTHKDLLTMGGSYCSMYSRFMTSSLTSENNLN